jgi:hypothetical protein
MPEVAFGADRNPTAVAIDKKMRSDAGFGANLNLVATARVLQVAPAEQLRCLVNLCVLPLDAQLEGFTQVLDADR